MVKTGICAFAALGLLACTLIVADDEKKPGSFKIEAPGVRVEGRREAQAFGRPVRASKVIGAKVMNEDKTNLGTVDDIVMDEHGKARFIVVAHGGTLGVGTKYTAVPFKAIDVHAKADSDERWVQLNVSPQVLEKAPTFTSDKWPDFNDNDWNTKNEGFFLDAPGVRIRLEK
jgi:sporulation protein YlmC with PRC-barrel domain